MRTAVIAIATAALMSAAATPTLAHCGASHGKSYRAAHAKRSAPKEAVAAAKPAEQIVAVGPQTMLIGGDGGSATF